VRSLWASSVVDNAELEYIENMTTSGEYESTQRAQQSTYSRKRPSIRLSWLVTDGIQCRSSVANRAAVTMSGRLTNSISSLGVLSMARQYARYRARSFSCSQHSKSNGVT